MLNLKIWKYGIATILVFNSACSSFDLIPSDSLIQRLKGRAPVLVSPDNPYLAANLLLQQESKSSKELAGFIETKGMPQALSVSQDFFSPARLLLYYKNGQEQYDLELLRGIWVINGPKTITDSSVRSLLQLSENLQEPSLNNKDPQSSKISSKVDPGLDPSSEQLMPLFDETPTNSKMPKTIDRLITQFANSPAESTPGGDIVHFVTSEQENLTIISQWYTKSKATISRVARANKISTSAVLSPGDQIVIPFELVKNKMRLPEEVIPLIAEQ